MRLASSRQFGMGIGPIPISEILAFVQYVGLDSAFERDRLLHLMGQADGVYLEEKAPKGEAGSK